MISIKDGATLLGLQPQMTIALFAAHELYMKYVDELVITAGNDGTHAESSEHYGGRALDLRTGNLPNPPTDGVELAKQLGKALGRDFQVLFEGDHLHVAFRPKRPVIQTKE